MYEKEMKNELKSIYNSSKKIDAELVNIKIAIKKKKKLGLNTKDLEKLVDNIGIEFYQFKKKNKV